MKLIQLLLEIEFRTYEAMVQIRFKEEVDGGYDDAIRALPGVTTVTLRNNRRKIMLFGSNRDFNLLTKVNRELLSDVIEQEILYYKFSLDETNANLYGEALDKVFQIPVKFNWLITRGDQVNRFQS